MLCILETHTTLFMAPTGVGKTAIDLLEREYFNHFDLVIILCPTLRYYKTYCQWKWFSTDPDVILIEPGYHLYDWIEKLGNLLQDGNFVSD